MEHVGEAGRHGGIVDMNAEYARLREFVASGYVDPVSGRGRGDGVPRGLEQRRRHDGTWPDDGERRHAESRPQFPPATAVTRDRHTRAERQPGGNPREARVTRRCPDEDVVIACFVGGAQHALADRQSGEAVEGADRHARIVGQVDQHVP